jgi:hypothetical protein
MNDEKLEKFWNKKVQTLVGKKIIKAEYISDEKTRNFFWNHKSLEITFDDGTSMILSSDDEGNEAGSAFTTIDNLEIIPKI